MTRRPCAGVAGSLAVALVVVGVLTGCKGGGSLESRMNDESKARLRQIPADGDVVVSLRGSTASTLGEASALEDGSRELGRAGTSVLLVVPRSSLDRLAGLGGLEEAVVWGASDIVARLDPMLRGRILEQIDDPATREAPLPMIATFSSATEGLEAELRDRGAVPRSVTGGVVTLDGSPEAAFGILSMPALQSLSQPRSMQWMREK